MTVRLAGVTATVRFGVGGGEAVRSVEEYDPETDSWRDRADLPTARTITVCVGCR